MGTVDVTWFMLVLGKPTDVNPSWPWHRLFMLLLGIP